MRDKRLLWLLMIQKHLLGFFCYHPVIIIYHHMDGEPQPWVQYRFLHITYLVF